MKKKKRNEISQLENFLASKGVLDSFIKNSKLYALNGGLDEDSFLEFAFDRSSLWKMLRINDAFYFWETEEGVIFWDEINLEWIDYILKGGR